MLAETVDLDEADSSASSRELDGFNGAIGKGIADLVQEQATAGQGLLDVNKMLGVMNRAGESSGAEVECRRVVRRDASGAVTVAAEDEEVEEASFAMRLAQLARMVAPLPPPEKAAFSAAMRAQGNAKFTEGDWSGAEDLYMQSLVGLDFGTTIDSTPCHNTEVSNMAAEEDSNKNLSRRSDATAKSPNKSNQGFDTGAADSKKADVLVTSASAITAVSSMVRSIQEEAARELASTTTAIQVPVLCNLVACALAQRKWSRAVLLADHALELDPTNWKALARKGHALLEMSKFGESRACLRAAAAEAPSDADAVGPRRLLARLRAAEDQARNAAQLHGAALGRGLWSMTGTAQTTSQTQDKRLYADRGLSAPRQSSRLRVASNPAFSKLTSSASLSSVAKKAPAAHEANEGHSSNPLRKNSAFGLVISSVLVLVLSLVLYRLLSAV